MVGAFEKVFPDVYLCPCGRLESYWGPYRPFESQDGTQKKETHFGKKTREKREEERAEATGRKKVVLRVKNARGRSNQA